MWEVAALASRPVFLEWRCLLTAVHLHWTIIIIMNPFAIDEVDKNSFCRKTKTSSSTGTSGRHVEYRYVNLVPIDWWMVLQRRLRCWLHQRTTTVPLLPYLLLPVHFVIQTIVSQGGKFRITAVVPTFLISIYHNLNQKMALLNLEVSPIQDQIASAVLDLQGNVLTLTTSTNPNQTIDSTATNLLYQIFLEVGSLHLPSFRRITISSASLSGSSSANIVNNNSNTDSNNIRYILTRDDAHIYIVAQKQ